MGSKKEKPAMRQNLAEMSDGKAPRKERWKVAQGIRVFDGYDSDAKDGKASAEFADLEKLAAAAGNFPAAKAPRPQAPRTEAQLVALGGKRDGGRIVFGGEQETRLEFQQERRPTFKKAGAVWKVTLRAVGVNSGLRDELNKAGRSLWNAGKDEPDIAYQAVEELLKVWASCRGVATNEQERGQIQFAIRATLTALRRDRNGSGRKLQLAYQLITRSAREARTVALHDLMLVDELQRHALELAAACERPPNKAELRESFGKLKKAEVDPAAFSKWLKIAGLRWLPNGTRSKKS
jgi:hypothetical protein